MCGVLTIPAGGWAGWKLFGARTGVYAAILFAFNAWLTAYAQETRMYEFMGLLGVLATAGFLLGFVLPPPALPVPVRRGADGDALHAHVGHVLLRRARRSR